MLFEVRVGMAIELKQHLLEFSEYLDKRIAEKKDVRSGYKDLDDIIGGFYGGKVYVVGARTGKGKTSFLTNIALNNSTSNKILVFSTEIGVNEFIERLIALSSDISVFSLRTQISELYDDIIFNRIDQLKQYNIFVNDSPNPGIGVICNEVKEVKPSLLIVDYLGQIFFKPTENVPRAISDLMVGLKKISREFNISVLVASQLNRDIEYRGGGPRLSDFKGSGGIEESADLAMFLDAPDDEYLEVTVAKSRYGPTGTVRVRFNRQTLKVSDDGRGENEREPDLRSLLSKHLNE